MPEDRDSRTRIRESWDENAAAWIRAVREGRIASRIDGTNRAIVEAIRAARARRILDVGCGEGWLAHVLACEGCDVTGFDGSADLIASAKTGPGHFTLLDYEAFVDDPAAVGSNFDAAVCNFSLFEENLGPLLAAILSRLAPAGHLIIQTVHPIVALGEHTYKDGWRTESFRSLHSGFEEMPWYFRTLGSWINVLGRAGFDVVRCNEPISDTTGLPMSLVLSCAVHR